MFLGCVRKLENLEKTRVDTRRTNTETPHIQYLKFRMQLGLFELRDSSGSCCTTLPPKGYCKFKLVISYSALIIDLYLSPVLEAWLHTSLLSTVSSPFRLYLPINLSGLSFCHSWTWVVLHQVLIKKAYSQLDPAFSTIPIVFQRKQTWCNMAWITVACGCWWSLLKFHNLFQLKNYQGVAFIDDDVKCIT